LTSLNTHSKIVLLSYKFLFNTLTGDTTMSAFACCFWWFLLGLLLGWLLNWLLSRWLRKDNGGNNGGSAGYASYNAAPTAAPEMRTAAAMPGGVDVVAAAAAGFSVKGMDDIIIIEGIGPKIKELFNTHGVSTFAQIAKMSVPEMSAILDKGGARFKLANPGSWAEQARLAANNEWAALKKLQDELYAGVAASDDGNT
jgi:predicted flap endonuclease-1-like 5' DNA nuclease